jgi:hypothetical protein
VRRALVALALVACSDVVIDTTDGNGASTASASVPGEDTIPRDAIVSCGARPDEDSPCRNVGASCEYGESPDPECNTTLVCEGAANSVAAWTPRAAHTCNLHECPKGNIASLDGQPCNVPSVDGGSPTPDAELQCTMTDGICACTTGPDGSHAHDRKWVCTSPTPDCPYQRPLAGQPCSPARLCDYGSCLFKRGLRMQCQSGVWLTGGSPTCD